MSAPRNADPSTPPDRHTAPRWVRAVVALAIALIVMVVVLHLLGGGLGGHGS